MSDPPWSLLEELRQYDPLLLIRWNPRAREEGRWEIRRRRSLERPEHESERDQWVMYVEEGPEDAPVVNLASAKESLMRAIRRADVWRRYGRTAMGAQQFVRDLKRADEAADAAAATLVSPLTGKVFAPQTNDEKADRLGWRQRTGKDDRTSRITGEPSPEPAV